jgi:hypothetical protein
MSERTHRDLFLLSIFTFLIGCVIGAGFYRLYKPSKVESSNAQNVAAAVLTATSPSVSPSSTTKAAEFRVRMQSDARLYAHWLWVVSRNADDARDTSAAEKNARERFIAIGEQVQHYYSDSILAEKIPALFAQHADAVLVYAIATGVGEEENMVSLSSVKMSQDEMVTQLVKMHPGLSNDVLQSLLREYVVGVEKRDYERMANALGKYVDAIVSATVRAFPEQF